MLSSCRTAKLPKQYLRDGSTCCPKPQQAGGRIATIPKIYLLNGPQLGCQNKKKAQNPIQWCGGQAKALGGTNGAWFGLKFGAGLHVLPKVTMTTDQFVQDSCKQLLFRPILQPVEQDVFEKLSRGPIIRETEKRLLEQSSILGEPWPLFGTWINHCCGNNFLQWFPVKELDRESAK